MSALTSVPGLTYHAHAVLPEEAAALAAVPWQTSNEYYRSRRGGPDGLDTATAHVLRKVNDLLGTNLNYVITKEYMLGSGEADRTYDPRTYGDTVAMLALGSPCMVQLTRPQYGQSDVHLDVQSLIALQGQARYDWKLGIPGRHYGRTGLCLILLFLQVLPS